MTKVLIKRDRTGHYLSFHCKGHAGYAEEGEDIVCAGISAIVINTCNCLDDLLEEQVIIRYSKDGGDISCVFRTIPSEKAALLVDCMIHGLEWIRTQYGKKYLNYKIKEV